MSRRLDAVDVARGGALIAMAAYHFTWDLAEAQVVDPSTPFTPTMRAASHLIGGAFLALAGVSLALAHAQGFRARGFWLRLARLGAAAGLVSGASLYIAPQTPIFFGILHCLLAASLVAVPFLLTPRAGPALVAGAVLIALPFVFASPAFDAPWLVWLGLGEIPPATLDWRPLTPWAGITLLAIGLTRLAPAIPAWRAQAAPWRALAFGGRHSLAVYLIHQPILMGALWAALHLSGYSERLSVEAYSRACRPACVEAGGEIDACDRACACVVRDAAAQGLAARLGAHALAETERSRIGQIVESCGSQGR